MKFVNYQSRDTGKTRAILLCEGDEGDVLLVPPSCEGEVPCLVIAPKERDVYTEGVWTNVGMRDLKQLERAVGEALAAGLKIPDVEEYKLYLKLRKKFEK